MADTEGLNNDRKWDGVEVEVDTLDAWAAQLAKLASIGDQRVDLKGVEYGYDARLTSAPALGKRANPVCQRGYEVARFVDEAFADLARVTKAIADGYRTTEAYNAASVDDVRAEFARDEAADGAMD
ncbi:MAG: hypothetical protein ACRDT6_21005 [Micromonosporaceae bacterium]